MKKQSAITILRFTKTTSLLGLVLLFTLLIENSAEAQNEEEKEKANKAILIDEIIAKVDNYIILKSDLEVRYQQYVTNGQSTPNLKCRLLSDLISQKLMVAKAEIDSVIVLDAQVDSELDRRMSTIIAQTGGSEERLEEYYGKPLAQIRSEIRDDLKQQLVIQKMQSNITSDVSVTPAEVKRFFNTIPKDSVPYFSTEVEVGQIVMIPEVGKVEMNKAKAKLMDLRRRVEAGEAFDGLAKEYSQGPSAQFGGELGFAKRGAMVPEYEAAALKLKPNEVSAPIKSPFGLHLIQLIERRGNEYNSRHILIRPTPSREDIDKTVRSLDSIRTLIIADSISFQKAAKEYSDDKTTADAGGFFLDATGAMRVSVENLDPVIFFATDTMNVGGISKPVEFRMDDGKDAVRILYYKSKVKPHQANLAEDWQKIKIAAENQKKSGILNDWFEKAKFDVFIRIDQNYDGCNIIQ